MNLSEVVCAQWPMCMFVESEDTPWTYSVCLKIMEKNTRVCVQSAPQATVSLHTGDGQDTTEPGKDVALNTVYRAGIVSAGDE